jgi:hypothetical protein
MKAIKYTSAVLLLVLGTMGFSSCIYKEDNTYNPQPTQPVGYQYVFNEEFDNDARGWTFDDPYDSAYAFVSNSLYKFVDYSYNGGTHTAVVPTGANTNYDFLAQTRMKSNYAMALIFGASNSDYGYSLFIDEQGYFALYDEGNSNSNIETIIDWTSSSAISSGWNDVEIEQVGDRWYGYVNNVKIFETPARYLSGNQFGFMVLAGTTGYADYLTVKY